MLLYDMMGDSVYGVTNISLSTVAAATAATATTVYHAAV
jgi:hypothetical protein